MKRRGWSALRRFLRLAAALIIVAAGGAWSIYRPDKTLRVATGQAAHTLCSDSFVSRLDPAQMFAQATEALPGNRRLAPYLHYVMDPAKHTVRVNLAGYFAAEAVYRGGIGCLLVVPGSGGEPAPPPPAAAPGTPLLPDIAGPDIVTPATPALRAAVDRFFVEPAAPPHRWIKALVIVQHDRVIAERYAPGVGIDTPLLGYSASKSVMAALAGILVRQQRLRVEAPAPVPAWQSPGDPRRAITLDNLLRMTSGLAITQTGSGYDRASRMLFTERDMAGYAEAAKLREPPGTTMDYSDASALIVARIVRDAAGGTGAAVQEFARRELFNPLGMHHVVMEQDATGTPVSSTFILASARDWARFGLLFLHDGVVGGQRILPANWVRYVARPTLGTSYGAGFWTNAGKDAGAAGRIRGGMPCDTFFASGILGQRVYIIPSADMVIVRLAVTQQWPDFDIIGDNRLIRAVLAALGLVPRPACE